MNQQTGKRLYEYRKANGYSQEAIAKLLGVSRQAVSKWERGESSPDTDNLIALSQIYNVTIDEMINSDSEPKNNQNQTGEEQREYTEKAAEETVSFKNGIHVHNGKDNVDISLRGIHVESENGDKVHIGKDCGVYVNSDSQEYYNSKANNQKNPWLHILLPLFAVAFYLFVGFSFDRGWAVGWLIFLIIPVIETIFTAVKTKNPSAFAYPVFAVGVYLSIGMLAGIWHPTWIIFITIPVYYALCDAFKRMKKSRQDDFSSAQGTYYTPEGVNIEGKKKNSRAGIIITIILSVLIIAAAGGGILYAVTQTENIGSNSIDFGSQVNYDNGDKYKTGGAKVNASLVDSLYVEWISGDVNMEYYNGDSISFSENNVPSSENYKLRYIIEDRTLRIEYCKSGTRLKSSLSKDLTVFIPENKALNDLEISVVSSDVEIKNLVVLNDFDAESVSGNINAAGKFKNIDFESVSGNVAITDEDTASRIDGETVSGRCSVTLPSVIKGFNVNYDTVSGDVSTEDFDGFKSDRKGSHNHSYGDGSINIDFSSVSGDLYIMKK